MYTLKAEWQRRIAATQWTRFWDLFEMTAFRIIKRYSSSIGCWHIFQHIEIFKSIFSYENCCILIQIPLKFVPINKIEPVSSFCLNQRWYSLPTHICVTRHWMKRLLDLGSPATSHHAILRTISAYIRTEGSLIYSFLNFNGVTVEV